MFGLLIRGFCFRLQLLTWTLNSRTPRICNCMCNNTTTGSRSIFYGVWILSQILLFSFALLHYALKDNLSAARAVFGGSYGMSRRVSSRRLRSAG